jgi:hypothetical protein
MKAVRLVTLKMAGVARPSGGLTSSIGTPSPSGGSAFSTISPLQCNMPLLQRCHTVSRQDLAVMTGGTSHSAAALTSSVHDASVCAYNSCAVTCRCNKLRPVKRKLKYLSRSRQTTPEAVHWWLAGLSADLLPIMLSPHSRCRHQGQHLPLRHRRLGERRSIPCVGIIWQFISHNQPELLMQLTMWHLFLKVDIEVHCAACLSPVEVQRLGGSSMT